MSIFAKFCLVVVLAYGAVIWWGIVSGSTGYRSYRVSRSDRPKAFRNLIAFQLAVVALFALMFFYGVLG